MSAVAGLFHRDGRGVHHADVRRMIDALAHRGSDAMGIWAAGPAGFGQRVAFTCAAFSQQGTLLVEEAGGYVVAADARLDNGGELRRALSVPGSERSTDAALLLRAYQRWGAECASRLLGDFAFAVWDPRERTVFCARDAMGVRPLYYHLTDRTFAFASEIKALFLCPGIAREVDDNAVALHFAGVADDRESTLFTGVRRLPAAHTLLVGPGRTVLKRYWTADSAPDVRLGTDDEYAAAFREVFTDAVRVRTRSAYPVGATLSGGLDSSSIVCVARQLNQPASFPIHTFSLVFPELPAEDRRLIDERPYIEQVTRLDGLVAHTVRGDLLSPLDDVERMLWHLDEPFAAPNLYLHWAMFGTARDAGVRVFLDGFDGDTTVSHGFGRLNGLMRDGEWSALETEVRAFARHRGVAPEAVLQHFALPYVADLARRGALTSWMRAARELTRRFRLSRTETVLAQGLAPLLPEFVDRSWRALRGHRTDEISLLRPSLARHVRSVTSDRARGASRMAAASEREMHLAALSQPLYQLTLEMADKCARAFGLEPRFPFFDRRLIEFCVGVPEEQRFVDGWPRSVFRRAMQGVLPAEIQWRSTKGNLAPNFDRKLRSTAGVTGGRTARARALARYVEPAALGRTENRFEASERGWRDDDGPVVFRAEVLARWLATGDGLEKPPQPHVEEPVPALA